MGVKKIAKLDVKNIAKVQLGIGCLLLIASIIAGILTTNLLYYEPLKDFQNSYERFYSEYGEELAKGGEFSLGYSQIDLLTAGLQVKLTIWIVSLVGSILSGILSIILILQGLVNLNRKK